MSVDLSSRVSRYSTAKRAYRNKNSRLMTQSLNNAQVIKAAIKKGDKNLVEKTLSELDCAVSINPNFLKNSGVNIKRNMSRQRQIQTVLAIQSHDIPVNHEFSKQKKRVQSASNFHNRQREMQKKLKQINKEMSIKNKNKILSKSIEPRPENHTRIQKPRHNKQFSVFSDVLSNSELQSTLRDSNVRRLVTTDLNEYFEVPKNNKEHKCINCAKCLSPQGGKLIRYRYPQAVGTTNHKIQSQFVQLSPKNSNNAASAERLQFNYDSIRNNIRAEHRKQFMTPKVVTQNANKIGFRAMKFIQEKPASTKTNCFLGTTSYKIQFEPADTIFKPFSTKPKNYPPVKHKFRAHSTYQNNFASKHHQKQASGAALFEERTQMRMRERQLVSENRKGFMTNNNPFEGKASSAIDQKAVLNSPIKITQGSAKEYKPMDSLLVSNQIRSVAKKSTKQYYFDAKQPIYCDYQKEIKRKQ